MQDTFGVPRFPFPESFTLGSKAPVEPGLRAVKSYNGERGTLNGERGAPTTI